MPIVITYSEISGLDTVAVLSILHNAKRCAALGSTKLIDSCCVTARMIAGRKRAGVVIVRSAGVMVFIAVNCAGYAS